VPPMSPQKRESIERWLGQGPASPPGLQPRGTEGAGPPTSTPEQGGGLISQLVTVSQLQKPNPKSSLFSNRCFKIKIIIAVLTKNDCSHESWDKCICFT